MVGIDAAGNGGPAGDDYLSDKDDNCRYSSGGYKSDDGRLSCGYLSFIGKRPSMEDFFDIKASEVAGQPVWMFGIFDGHGGARAARFLRRNLFDNLLKHPKFITDTKLAISETYQLTDIDFLESIRDTLRDDGSTASTAVLIGNHLYVANVGDSRTIISKDGIAIPLSDDHKPNRIDERQRIESAGGRITWSGTWRVGGILAMSRAFGNRTLKRFVVAEPEIKEMEINEDLEFIVLATDGLWDDVSNEDAVSIVSREEDPETGARKLTEAAFSRGSTDNITCMVVKLHNIMKSDLDKDPIEKSDPEKDPFKNSDSEEIQSMKKVDLESGLMKADPEMKDPVMKSDPEELKDPITKSDPEELKDPFKKSDMEEMKDLFKKPGPEEMKDPFQKSDPEEMKDPFQKSDPEPEEMKVNPMKLDPELEEIHPMKLDPEPEEIYLLMTNPEMKDPFKKSDPEEIQPMKADPEIVLAYTEDCMHVQFLEA